MLQNGIRLIIVMGIMTTIAFIILAFLYFRPITLATTVPIFVISSAIYAIIQRKHDYLWPIIGISVSAN